MNKTLFFVAAIFYFGMSSRAQEQLPPKPKQCRKCLLLAEQSEYISIADLETQKLIWQWKPEESGIKSEHIQWFSDPDEVKPVYDGKYLLVTASGGGVALIRIADKKVFFYAYVNGNPHSAEVLPDGNIVTASSTGNYLTLFHVDTTAQAGEIVGKRIPIAFGHNVVWDAKHQLLWSAAMDHIKSFRYNFNCLRPDLQLVDSIGIPGTEAHDLFPLYGSDTLWLTNTTDIYKFDVNSKKFILAGTYPNIKSVSSGPAGYPTVIILPKIEYWTDEVIDLQGKSIFKQKGLKIYKARWLLENSFSYPLPEGFKQCQ